MKCKKGVSSVPVAHRSPVSLTDPEEIKGNIPMITDVQRIVVKRDNTEIKTNTLILTFNTPKIPNSLKKLLYEYSCFAVCTQSH